MLKAGAGKACINPTTDMFPLPSPKRSDWGIKPIQTEAIYNDISVRALALDNGQDKMIFVVYECSGIPHVDGLKEAIAEETGFPADNVILLATHNHTGIKDAPFRPEDELSDEECACMERYKEIEKEGGLRAAAQAAASMRPARYGFGETLSYINTNRDYQTLGGYWVEARNLAGYSDKTLAIVKLIDEEGRLIAALLNHPTHATCCYLMQDADHIRKTSGNFNSIACDFVEQHYGNGAVCLWTSGAAGNQNPLLSHGLQYEYPDGWTSAVDYPDGVGFMQMELMGRTHGADAVKGIDSINAYSDEMQICHYRRSAYLPSQKRVDGDHMAFRMGGRGTDRSSISFGQIPAPSEGPEMADGDEPVELRMQLILLGDIAIIGMNAEPYCEIGRDIKAASPFKNTFVVTHTDTKKAGYILDKSSKDHKVFQAFSQVKPGSSDELILECEQELFREAGAL